MSKESVAEILNDIGVLVMRDVRADHDGAFLYTEAEDGSVAASIFKELSDRVLYRRCSNTLTDRILDAWYAADADKKWNALFYTITGDSFSAKFQYDENWDDEEDYSERRPRILLAKYGNKPVDYSDPGEID